MPIHTESSISFSLDGDVLISQAKVKKLIDEMIASYGAAYDMHCRTIQQSAVYGDADRYNAVKAEDAKASVAALRAFKAKLGLDKE